MITNDSGADRDMGVRHFGKLSLLEAALSSLLLDAVRASDPHTAPDGLVCSLDANGGIQVEYTHDGISLSGEAW